MGIILLFAMSYQGGKMPGRAPKETREAGEGMGGGPMDPLPLLHTQQNHFSEHLGHSTANQGAASAIPVSRDPAITRGKALTNSLRCKITQVSWSSSLSPTDRPSQSIQSIF